MDNRSAIEKRRFKRIPVSLPVKLLVQGVLECRGTITDMSAGNMAVTCKYPVKCGDEIIAYVSGIDRVEGIVCRHMGASFAAELNTSGLKRKRIIEMLTLEAAKHDGLIEHSDIIYERRRLMRRRQVNQESICHLSTGQKIKCSVIDLSITGVAIEIAPILKIGEQVRIGQMRAKVIRQLPNGYALELAGPDQSNEPNDALLVKERGGLATSFEKAVKKTERLLTGF